MYRYQGGECMENTMDNNAEIVRDVEYQRWDSEDDENAYLGWSTASEDKVSRRLFLLGVCSRQDEAGLHLMITSGWDVNEIFRQRRETFTSFGSVILNDNFRALHQVAREGWLKGVDMLLEAGADIDASDYRDSKDRGWSYTALMHVASRGCEPLVNSLVNHGADINARDPITHHTALLLAAVSCSYPCVQYLVRHGAKVNIVGFDNNTTPATPILAAVYYFRLPLCHHLSHEWNSPEGRERSRQRALQLMTFLIDSGCDVNSYGNDLPPLHSSAVCSDTRALELLLQSGADVDMITDPARCSHQTTALTEAALANNISGVQTLIQHGAMVNLKCPEDPWDTNVRSLLTRIVFRKFFEIAEVLIFVGSHTTADDRGRMETFLKESESNEDVYPHPAESGGTGRSSFVSDIALPPVSQRVRTKQMKIDAVRNSLVFLSQPRPLKWCCRHAIRSAPSLALPSNIDLLPLPTVLKGYLMCRDL